LLQTVLLLLRACRCLAMAASTYSAIQAFQPSCHNLFVNLYSMLCSLCWVNMVTENRVIKPSQTSLFNEPNFGWLVYSCCSHLEHRTFVKLFVSLQFLNLRHSVGFLWLVISPSQGRYLLQKQNKHKQTSMPRVVFEPTVTAFEREKAVHALYRASAVIGKPYLMNQILPYPNFSFLIIFSLVSPFWIATYFIYFLQAKKFHFSSFETYSFSL
jgi:hypothetical protein